MNKNLSTILFLIIFSLSITGCSLNLQSFIHKSKPVSNYPAENIYENSEEIYKQTLAMLENAKSSIYIEQNVLTDSTIIESLIRKSRAGIDVRIILDQWQSSNRSTVEQLKNQGISIQYYPALKGQNDHVKLLITDHNQAMFYSANWSQDSWISHSLALKMDGQIAWRCDSLFARDWEFTTTLTLPVPKSTNAPEDQITLASNAKVKQEILTEIKESKNNISLELTEIGDPEIVTALLDAVKKGVNIRIILDSHEAENSPITLGNLRTGGIGIRFYPPNQKALNVNFGVFDGTSSIISSSGWTNAVFVRNHEISVTIPSPAATAKMTQYFEQDWAISSN